MNILNLISEQKRKRENRKLRDGYDFAAGALLRGESTVESLEAQASTPWDKNDFDLGILVAIKDWEKRNESL